MGTVPIPTTVSAVGNATEIYAYCAKENPYSTESLLTCLTTSIIEHNNSKLEGTSTNARAIHNMILIFSASLVFFMQAGFAMVCAGAVRRKNIQNTMLKNLLDACSSALAFYAIGYAFAYGGDDYDNNVKNNAGGGGGVPNGFIGTTNFFLRGVDDTAFFFFQYTFSAASATIVAGTLAERCTMSAYFLYTFIVSGFVYPVAAHFVWSPYGFLSATKHPDSENPPLFGVGLVDIAGSGVVHVIGGTTALVAAICLGPRRGRFHDEKTGKLLKEPKPIHGHSLSLQLLGTMILWFGWYGFNAGSAYVYGGTDHGDTLMALAATNTTLGAASGGCTSLFVVYLYTYFTNEESIHLEGGTGSSSTAPGAVATRGKFDLVSCMNGVLIGLVAITAGCAVVEPWAAIVIGFVAGTLYPFSSWFLTKLYIDDAVDAIPVHLVGGIWGLLSLGIFASPDRLIQAYGRGDYPGFIYPGGGEERVHSVRLLAAQVVGSLVLFFWAFGMMTPFFLCLQRLGNLRVRAREEVDGLDRVYSGGVIGGGLLGGAAGGAGGLLPIEETLTEEELKTITEKVASHLRQRKRQQEQEIRTMLGPSRNKPSSSNSLKPPSEHSGTRSTTDEELPV